MTACATIPFVSGSSFILKRSERSQALLQDKNNSLFFLVFIYSPADGSPPWCSPESRAVPALLPRWTSGEVAPPASGLHLQTVPSRVWRTRKGLGSQSEHEVNKTQEQEAHSFRVQHKLYLVLWDSVYNVYVSTLAQTPSYLLCLIKLTLGLTH